MRTRLGLLALALVLPVVPALALEPAPAPAPSALGVPAALDAAAAQQVARDALAAAGLAVTGREVEDVRTSLIGTHLRGREHRGGVPVEGTDFVVSLLAGSVVARSDAGAALAGAPTAVPVAVAAAEEVATDHLGVVTALKVTSERLLVTRAGRLADTWRVHVAAVEPAVAATVDVDAETGRVVAVGDDRRFVDATAKVFDPNPVVTRRDASLRQPLESGEAADPDLDSAELTAARRDLPLRGLDDTAFATGRLIGPHVNVLGGGYVTSPLTPRAFDVTRSDPRFEGLMAYAHLDGIQRYFQSLGFTGDKAVNLEPQDVVATRVEGYDNSFYQPGNDLMLLGAGGVDDGEDAEVIVHEYGHAVHDAQVKGWGARPEGGAMGEGFGDFLAAAYYARVSGGFQDTCIMDWDATTYSAANPPCLRRADSAKRYPEDLKNAVHADGELWSSFLWRLRARLTTDPARQSDEIIRLVLTSHELLTPTADFGDAVAALRAAAEQLDRPTWPELIDAEATTTGFPLS